jgi:YD repeat-containing protein
MKRSAISLSLLGLASTPCSAGETVTYRYDVLGRLEKATTTGSVNNGSERAVTYDPAGNRVTYKATGSKSKVVVVPLNGLTVIPIPDN